MLNFDEKEEAKMEQEAFAVSDVHEQAIYMSAAQFAKHSQYRVLLMTLQTVAQTDSYALERVATAIVAAFEKLEGAGC